MPTKNNESSIDEKIAKLPRDYLSLYSLYSTAEESYLDYYTFLLKAAESTDEHKRTNLIIKRFHHRDITVVFSHLFLEAIIYDYGAINTSDSYMKKYVDKLEFLSKWVVIPKIVTGKQFPTDSQAFELLGKLKKTRNDIVHFKTRKISYNKTTTDIKSKFIDEFDIVNCFDCMSEALKELSNLDIKNWPLFEWGFIQQLISKKYRDIREVSFERLREIC